jgi:hypothetical protein
MLWTIFVILLVLWLLGVVTSYTVGGFIHVLLVVAVILAVMQLAAFFANRFFSRRQIPASGRSHVELRHVRY